MNRARNTYVFGRQWKEGSEWEEEHALEDLGSAATPQFTCNNPDSRLYNPRHLFHIEQRAICCGPCDSRPSKEVRST